MLATASEPYFYPNHATQPLEIHRSKISLHHAKAGYSYPTIRLPHTFSKLVGLSTRIFQTVHEGALAFLVVISCKEKAAESPKTSVFTRRRSPVRIRPSPSFFLQEAAQCAAAAKESIRSGIDHASHCHFSSHISNPIESCESRISCLRNLVLEI